MTSYKYTCMIIDLCCIYFIVALENACFRNHNKTSVNCKNMGLTYVPQNLPSRIVYLDLTNNSISTLKNNSFKRYGQLQTLIIDHNLLNTLEANAFGGLTCLYNLSMRNNQLNLTSYVFHSLPSLTKLDLRRNAPKNNPTDFGYPYFGLLQNLTHLFMDITSNPTFNGSGIQNLSRLKVLRFERCHLDGMLDTTFVDFPKTISEIYFRGCNSYIRNVHRNFLSNFPTLKVLSIQEANINFYDVLQILYPFRNKNMTVIQFVGTVKVTQQAVILTKTMLSYLNTICVSTLVLAENEIVDFEQGSLLSHKHPECFENVVLSGNRFSIVRGNIGELYKLSTQMIQLKVFDFSYNTIKYTNIKNLCLPGLQTECDDKLPLRTSSSVTEYADKETNFPEVSMVYNYKSTPNVSILFPNNMTTLRMTHFLSDGWSGHQYLLRNTDALKNVDISYVQMTVFPNIYFDGSINIKYLDISGIDSTLYCNRVDIPLFKYIDTVIMKDARLEESFRKTNKLFTLIPSVKSLDISWNNIYMVDPNAFSANKNLSQLKMSFNLLHAIPKAVIQLPLLSVLDIQYNRLHTINKTLRDWMDNQNKTMGKFELFLWGNVFQCTCDTVDFITWLFHTQVKLDKKYKNYKCTLINGTETNIAYVYQNLHQYFRECNSKFWLRFGIGWLTGFCVFTLPLALLVNYRWKLAFWIYRKFRRVITKKMERKFVYDVYLSYPKCCCGWIKNILIPKIEGSWELKMCFEERDFLPGEIKADAIADSIYESRHVIFVISDDAEENLWREYEIERTKFEKCTNDLQKIILITKNASCTDIPYQLDRILTDVTIIEWADDNEIIWDKLRMIIFSGSI